MLESPLFIRLGFGERVEVNDPNDEQGFAYELKEGAPEAAVKSFKTYQAWLNNDVSKYDDFEEYEQAMENKTNPLFGFTSEEKQTQKNNTIY